MPLTLPSKFGWHLETPILLTQAPPIQNQWYTVCDFHDGIMGVYLKIVQGNTEELNKDIEIEVTVDDIVFKTDPTYGLADSIICYSSLKNGGLGQIEDGIVECSNNNAKFLGLIQVHNDTNNWNDAEMIQCHDLKIRVRMTSIPGTAQTMTECLWYQRKTII